MAYSATQLQLTHVLQGVYRRLGGKVLLATGGSTTTVIDSKLAEDLAEGNEDDVWNGGTVIVIEDAGGAAAAPEGEFSRITDYVSSSYTATFSPAVTAAIAANDRVLVAPPDFPLYDVIEVVNDALRNLGEIPLVNTSLTTASSQTEYTIPIALKGENLINVEIQGTTSDSNDNEYFPVPGWKIVPAATGTAETLVIPQYSAGYTIRLTYLGRHTRVDAFDDPINEYLSPELVHAAVMAHVLQWRNDSALVSGGADENMIKLESKAWSQYDRAKIEHKIERPVRQVSGFTGYVTPYTERELKPIPETSDT